MTLGLFTDLCFNVQSTQTKKYYKNGPGETHCCITVRKLLEKTCSIPAGDIVSMIEDQEKMYFFWATGEL